MDTDKKRFLLFFLSVSICVYLWLISLHFLLCVSGITLHHAGHIVFYHWREQNRGELLNMTRDPLAQVRQLFTHTGTIHSVLHFVWFCGFARGE
jgi:hypothetical protein